MLMGKKEASPPAGNSEEEKKQPLPEPEKPRMKVSAKPTKTKPEPMTGVRRLEGATKGVAKGCAKVGRSKGVPVVSKYAKHG